MSADPIVAHVRFSDHVARCADCTGWELCERGHELFVTWQRAEQLATKCAEDVDSGFALDDEYQSHLGRS